MRFMHLADLHIGKRVHEFSMLEEQRHAFAQMHEAALQGVDAVLIAGDVFDRSTPSREALELAEELLAGFIELRVPVFMIPGNHDSAQQVSYCSSITAAAGLHVAKAYRGSIDSYCLEDEFGTVRVHLLPFVRPTDVRVAVPDRADEVASHHDAVRIALEQHELDPEERHVLVAHQFVVNGQDEPETCDSETLNVGGIDSVQAGLFDAFDYVALGHIHGKQQVKRPNIRYCGSPVKYSFSEVRHTKCITIAELGGTDGRELSIEEIPLSPLHDMRELTASFDELLAGCDMLDHEDYLRITLTDTAAYDAYARLRTLYPNLLRIDWQDSLASSAGGAAAQEQARPCSPQELFADFYRMQTGESLTEEELAVFESVLANMGEEGGLQ